MKARLLALAGVMAFFPGSGCDRPPPPDWPTSPPSVLCDDPSLGDDDLCMPAARIERILRDGDLNITNAALSETGVTAPAKLRIEVRSGGQTISFNAKFKPAPIPEADAFNNSPRRELAAYELQKLFLDEDDWVVPPTALRCLDLDRYGRWLDGAKPWPGTNCALGLLAFWLDEASTERVLDAERFKRDAAYRYHLSNANVVTALIGHEDSLGKNMMISTDPERPRIFAIDNGLAFEAMEYNPIVLLSGAWGDMRVPVIPVQTARRLKEIDADDLDTLRVVAQMERRDGRLVHVEHSAPMATKEGVRKRGAVIQWGLTVEETSNVHERLVELIAEINQQELRPIEKPRRDNRAADPAAEGKEVEERQPVSGKEKPPG